MKSSESTNRPNFTPYANRWVALAQGRVIGSGLTRQQAQRAAKQVRPKDKPELWFVNANGQLTQPHAETSVSKIAAQLPRYPLLQQTLDILRNRQIEAYLVGGPVRDLLLGRENIVDFDFAIPGDGLAIARQVANALNAAFYPLDPQRGTGRVVYQPANAAQIYLDFATFRGPSLEADLRDRDFTINAIALSLFDPPQLIDPLQGRQDLTAGQIRVCADTSFLSDPARTLRAVRLAAQLDFSIEAGTEKLLAQAAPHLTRVSPERQRDELLKLLNTPAPGRAVKMLHRLTVLPHLLPEVEATVGVMQGPPHHLDVFSHTLAALDFWADAQQAGWPDIPPRLREPANQLLNESLAGNVTQRSLMPLALLLHDIGKPLTRTEEIVAGQVRTRFLGHEQQSANLARQILNRLHFSRQAGDFVQTVVAQHMRPLALASAKKVSRRALYRFFRDTGSAAFQAGVAVALHALADHRATYPAGRGQKETEALLSVTHQLIKAYVEQKEVVDPPLLLSGRDLIELGLSEGRLIGTLLNRLREAQAAGQVSSRASALEFIKTDPDFANYQKEEHN